VMFFFVSNFRDHVEWWFDDALKRTLKFDRISTNFHPQFHIFSL
jgi:hypothetical protein